MAVTRPSLFAKGVLPTIQHVQLRYAKREVFERRKVFIRRWGHEQEYHFKGIVIK